ncbi:hypothetical protein EUA02_09210 [Mycobacterium paragordonae]|nr:hypothetical protein EUA02_09210 [Mycobacterium paragordonae]TDL08915.1 hypothetical protein EUA05_10760 [Mycobacterium paragordonae]
MAADVGLVACGVLATVESPDPHPANARMHAAARAAARQGSDNTPGTVPSARFRLWQAWPGSCQVAGTQRSWLGDFINPRGSLHRNRISLQLGLSEQARRSEGLVNVVFHRGAGGADVSHSRPERDR